MKTKANKKKSNGLGKGLGDLLHSFEPILQEDINKSDLIQVSLDLLVVYKEQPRKNFTDKDIEELSLSILEHGVLQPILVRKQGDKYQIIAGERRYRASCKANLKEVPAVVMDISDKKMNEIALVENIQRKDLSPIEEGYGYYHMIEDFGYTQEKLSKVIGKSRTYITNALRLLQLPKEIKDMLEQDVLTVGHVRPLVNRPDAVKLANKIVKQQLSVRDVGKLLNKDKSKVNNKGKSRAKQNPVELFAKAIIDKHLGCKSTVKITNRGSGQVVINFDNQSHLDAIVNLFKK